MKTSASVPDEMFLYRNDMWIPDMSDMSDICNI